MRITDWTQMIVGQTYYQVCVGTSRPVVFRGDGGMYQFDRGYESQQIFLEGGINGSGVCFWNDNNTSLNGLFTTEKSAQEWIGTEEYRTRLAEHREVCRRFDEMYPIGDYYDYEYV